MAVSVLWDRHYRVLHQRRWADLRGNCGCSAPERHRNDCTFSAMTLSERQRAA